MKATIGATRILLPGDAELDAQDDLLASGVDLRADILKVPHHGSAYSDPAFLQAVHAQLALVSVGRDNDYGHPSPLLIAEMARLGVPVRRTDQDGDIAVLRDGSRLVPVVHSTRTGNARGPPCCRLLGCFADCSAAAMMSCTCTGCTSGREMPMRSASPRRLTIGGAVVAAVCAASLAGAGAGGASPGTATDYLTDTAANHDASSLAQVLTPVLLEQRNFAGVRIASAGVEVATVGPPAASLLTAVNAANAAAIRPVSVYYRQVPNSHLGLTRTSDSIGSNSALWARRGVYISAVGLDAQSNSVRVFLSSYSAQAAALLEAAFPGLVTVDPESRSFAVS
jgi:hypothetical protein